MKDRELTLIEKNQIKQFVEHIYKAFYNLNSSNTLSELCLRINSIEIKLDKLYDNIPEIIELANKFEKDDNRN